VAVLDRFPRLSQGFLLYLVVVVLGFVLVLLSTAVRATATREIFARLRAEGFRKGLLAEPREHKELSNVPGQFANSIYQGTSNVSDMYGYLLEVGQYALTLAATMWVLWNKSWQFAWFCGGLIVV
jgi:ABC transporter transmembrane region